MSDEHRKTTDYTTSFEYPLIEKIHGEPDYEQFKNLKDKLKANAAKITSDLGGGGHGHLDLVPFRTRIRQCLSRTLCPALTPRRYSHPPDATECSEKRHRDEHKRLMELFHETVNLEHTLKKRITGSVEDLYLEELRDPTTNTILSSIPFILNHLFTNHDKVEPDSVTEKESNVRKKQFTVADPLTKL